jgi:hypothetical protein
MLRAKDRDELEFLFADHVRRLTGEYPDDSPEPETTDAHDALKNSE